MSYSVTFDENILNRFVIRLNANTHQKTHTTTAILDTACSTTLVPLRYAKQCGKRLNHSSTIIVGGKSYSATLYLFENVSIGSWNMGKLVAFASNYEGALENRALIGLNVLNHLSLHIHRNSGVITFDYDPWNLVKSKKYPCAMFFKDKGSAPVYPAEFMVEDVYKEETRA